MSVTENIVRVKYNTLKMTLLQLNCYEILTREKTKEKQNIEKQIKELNEKYPEYLLWQIL